MKNIKYFIVMLITLLLPFVVNAKVLEYGDNVDITEDVNSSKVVFGNKINNEASIDGASIIAGAEIDDTGKSDIAFYAAQSVHFGGEVKKDLFIAGQNVTLGEDAKISRDVFIAAQDVLIKTDLKHNLRVAAETVDLRGVNVKGNVTIYATTLKMDDKTNINGTLKYSKDTIVEGKDKANVGNVVVSNFTTKPTTKEIVINTINDAVLSVIISFFTIAVIYFVFPKLKNKIYSIEYDANVFGWDLVKGFLFLIAVPVIAIFAMVSEVLLPISLMLLALYFMIIYLGSIILVGLLSHLLFKRLNKEINIYLEILIGLSLFKLISFIPVFGAGIEFMILLAGIGLIYDIINQVRK